MIQSKKSNIILKKGGTEGGGREKEKKEKERNRGGGKREIENVKEGNIHIQEKRGRMRRTGERIKKGVRKEREKGD